VTGDRGDLCLGAPRNGQARYSGSVNAEVIENLTFAQHDDIGDRAELLLKISEKEKEIEVKERDLVEAEKDMKFLSKLIEDKETVLSDYRQVTTLYRAGVSQFASLYKALAEMMKLRADEIPAELVAFAQEMQKDAEAIAARFSEPRESRKS